MKYSGAYQCSGVLIVGVTTILLGLSACSQSARPTQMTAPQSSIANVNQLNPQLLVNQVPVELVPLTPWSPQIEGLSSSNHDPETSIIETELTAKGEVLLANEKVTSESIFTFDIPMTEQLGTGGSLTLVAESNFRLSGVSTKARPILISLSDGSHDYLNLRDTTSPDQGCFDHAVRSFVQSREQCSVQQPSIFKGIGEWLNSNYYWYRPDRQDYVVRDQLQTTVNVTTVPTCDSSESRQGCVFNSTFFNGNQLSHGFGVTYKAKYILVAPVEKGSFQKKSPLLLRLKVVKKIAKSNAKKAIDLNVIIVGAANIQASRTPKGQSNLNALFTHVFHHFNQPTVGIKLGRIYVTEWHSPTVIHPYQYVSLSTLGALFQEGSGLIKAGPLARAIPIYLVTDILPRTVPSVLGAMSQFPLPSVSVNTKGGIAIGVSRIFAWNPVCTGVSPCDLSLQEPLFIKLARTVSQEIGLALGLKHSYERFTQVTDSLSDVPKCVGGDLSDYHAHHACLTSLEAHPISGKSCAETCSHYDLDQHFCPDQMECAFNYLMWPWTNDPRVGLGDGTLISPAGGVVLRFSPWVF